jgi:hypothetical protein
MNMFDASEFVETEGEAPIKCDKLKCKGEIPSPRWGHSSGLYEGKIYMFGGRNDRDLKDLYCFTPESNEWKNVTKSK